MPRLSISDGSIELLKWLALTAMTIDHVNKFLFNGTNSDAFAIGRIAMPLFVFTLAYNLSRSGIDSRDYHRTMLRLVLCGAISIPAFILMGDINAALQPLNIMFTLLALTIILYLIKTGKVSGYVVAVAVFIVGGSIVEFSWQAIAIGVGVWWYSIRPGTLALFLAISSLAALWTINGNLWALVALPLIVFASLIDVRITRKQRLFYTYYPLHLYALNLIRVPMRDVGYLFF